MSRQWKIIDKFSAKFSLNEKRYYQMNTKRYYQRADAINRFNNFFIHKTNAENEQCTSTATFVSAQLKLTDIPQSIIDDIYNKTKGILEYGSFLK